MLCFPPAVPTLSAGVWGTAGGQRPAAATYSTHASRPGRARLFKYAEPGRYNTVARPLTVLYSTSGRAQRYIVFGGRLLLFIMLLLVVPGARQHSK